MIHRTATNSVHDRGFAPQPCRMGGTIYSFSNGKKCSYKCKTFQLFLSSSMAAAQNLDLPQVDLMNFRVENGRASDEVARGLVRRVLNKQDEGLFRKSTQNHFITQEKMFPLRDFKDQRTAYPTSFSGSLILPPLGVVRWGTLGTRLVRTFRFCHVI